MKLYTPCIDTRTSLTARPDREDTTPMPVMVAQNFSWRVLFLGWIGLLTYGAWVPALLAGAASILLECAAPGTPALIGIATLHVALAAFTPEIRIWDQALSGRQVNQPVAAPNRAFALLRWLDRQRTIQPPELPCASS